MNEGPLILFDGICNLCNHSVQFVIRHDKHKRFSFASLQGKTGIERLQQFQLTSSQLSSFVLIQNGKAYTKSTAALQVARQLNGPVKLLAVFLIVPRFIRDAVYDLIARNRYRWFGKKDQCMIPHPSLASRFLND